MDAPTESWAWWQYILLFLAFVSALYASVPEQWIRWWQRPRKRRQIEDADQHAKLLDNLKEGHETYRSIGAGIEGSAAQVRLDVLDKFLADILEEKLEREKKDQAGVFCINVLKREKDLAKAMQMITERLHRVQ